MGLGHVESSRITKIYFVQIFYYPNKDPVAYKYFPFVPLLL